ncbi:putative transcriptional regulator, TetR [Actinomadura sp. NBRC 104412]|uniref:TetR/AcrR family transcriptional regulator n=1 Tax=Actinomadura sp. NBRC 104412 TaxID=3032203 RepID=UPI0024A405F2|nr:TetR/AcrR family transcriptional regulator [Actinomadura sp. NBRC 104412]GLZ08418.1 putative transcriptional regulator, TetR [Actinomadura sp. NBRC 104412]
MERQWSARGSAARQRILQAATEEMAATGDIEVAAVARRAGVSVGLPYRYFGTRSGLVSAVISDFHDRLDEAVTNREFDGDTWYERERARVTAWVDHLYDDPLAPVVLSRQGGDAGKAGIETQRLHKAIEQGARNIARGQRDGDLPSDRDPELLVAAILGGVHTAVAVALTRTPRPDRSRVAAELWAFVAGAVGAANTSGRTS